MLNTLINKKIKVTPLNSLGFSSQTSKVKKRPKIATALLLGFLSLGCGPDVASPGRLVIVGGALKADNADVYNAVVEGRRGDGPICVVPTASSDAEKAMEGAVERLAQYGGSGSAKGILISTETPERAQDPLVAAELGTCSGFYFTGGSQSRILDVFLPAGDTTLAYEALMRRWREGAVVAGSSAGAAMMSQTMISGGSSREAITDGVAKETDADGVQLRDGMGFFAPAMIDQHFLARGRIGRLLVAVINQDSPRIGFGIDENTALIVDNDSARVVGASGVVVVDGRHIDAVGSHMATGLVMNLMGSGDVIDLGSLQVRRSNTSTRLSPDRRTLEAPADPFSRWAFLHLLVELSTSQETEVTVETDVAKLTLRAEEGFTAMMTALQGGPEGTPLGFSAGPLTVDLLPPVSD